MRHLTKPIEVERGIIYEFPKSYEQKGKYQPWNGYNPRCRLKHKEECQYVPSQTANIKIGTIYNGIEHDGDEWMIKASEVARKSVKKDGGPFGALILQIDSESNEVIRYWTNHNRVTSIADPTAHAEVMTIRSACHSLGVFNLGEIHQSESKLPQPSEMSYCVIYSSAEPCPMCYAAICWANLKALMFAATRFDAAVQGVDFSDEHIYNELELPYSKRDLKIMQCTTDNSLDAFNLWKRKEKMEY